MPAAIARRLPNLLMPISWSPWHPDAFARARAEAKPVLLSISATWSHWCREMDRTSYADETVAEQVNSRFVPVRVDADRRPDIMERYGLGGLPTTAFLTAEGAIVTGGTFVSVGRFATVLSQVADAFAARREEIAARSMAAGERSSPAPAAAPRSDSLLDAILQTYDAAHGGFGTGPKFPLTAPLHLALDLHAETGDAVWRAMVECTLDAMGSGDLHDQVDGGFFRSATSRDWTLPQREKLLPVNAALLGVLVDAGTVLNVARYADVAAGIIRYAQTWLADQAEGGWGGSQCADELYFSLRTPAERAAQTAPPVDRTLYSVWNGAMISAALRAAHTTNDAALGEFAIASLERVLLLCYRPGAGVAHYFDGEPRVRGLLDDQIAMATAALDAAEATGTVPYEMMAEELALYVLRTMWDEHAGGLRDRAPGNDPDDIGLLRRTVKPFVSNCEASRLFARLATVSGNHEFADRARETLASIAPCAAQQGPLAAHYLLAVREAGLR
ncbi:MAG TPA: DUF255 domain-containing protein [Vicinamibacterales bacterium]|nr:DUF255 domain-containing protein [Vicinamibacterales bacterium]